ncbi:hypothetical protein Rhopal_002472-T1 [Rhodotorula paludigena]|uniref:Uncharacterized protein n=1 Tax=Rhodotorula paludigena TaxID=86838 RepID=A0AAV5GJ34_9BASI|nr:hypothetical protein Rhopal_002472-T1 [Rhodotorula paludigena]
MADESHMHDPWCLPMTEQLAKIAPLHTEHGQDTNAIWGLGARYDWPIHLILVRRDAGLASGAELEQDFPIEVQRFLAERGQPGNMQTSSWIVSFLLILQDVHQKAWAAPPKALPSPALVYALRGLRMFVFMNAELRDRGPHSLEGRLQRLKPVTKQSLQAFAHGRAYAQNRPPWSIGSGTFLTKLLARSWMTAAEQELKLVHPGMHVSRDALRELSVQNKAAFNMAIELCKAAAPPRFSDAERFLILELVRRHGKLAAGIELETPYPLDCQKVRIIKLLAWSTRDLAALNNVPPFRLTHHTFPTARQTGKRESFVVKGEHGSSGTMVTLPWLMTFLLLLHDIERLAFATKPGQTPSAALVYALRGLRIFMEEDAELAQLANDVLAERLPGLQPLSAAALKRFAELNSADTLWSAYFEAYLAAQGRRTGVAVQQAVRSLAKSSLPSVFEPVARSQPF